MKKLSNTEGELKKGVPYRKVRISPNKKTANY